MDDILTQLGIDTSSPINKQDILQLIETGLKENQSFAKYFADTILSELQNKFKRLKIDSTPIKIDGAAISEDINKHISESLDKQIEETVKQTKESIQKTTKDLSKEKPITISSLLGQTPKMSVFTQMRYNSLAKSILDRIESGLPQKIELGKKDGLQLSSIFAPPGDSLYPLQGTRLAWRWNSLKRDILDKIKPPAKKIRLSEENLTLTDIFAPPKDNLYPLQGIRFAWKWNILRQGILDKIKPPAKNIKLSEDNLTLSDIFTPPKDNLYPLQGIRYAWKWNTLKQNILNKIRPPQNIIKIGSDDLTLGDIFAPPRDRIYPLQGARLAWRWNTLRRQLLDKIKLPDEINLKNNISINDIMGVTPKAGLVTRLMWGSLQRKLIGKISKGIDTNDIEDSEPTTKKKKKATKGKKDDFISRPGRDIQEFSKDDTIFGVKNPAKLLQGIFGQKKEDKKEFKTLEEKEPEVKIGGFTKNALDELVKSGALKGGVADKAGAASKSGGLIDMAKDSLKTMIQGKLSGVLTKAAASLGVMFKPLLSKLPLIGSILNFAWAFKAFKEGDTLGGSIKMAAGLAGLIPGIGPILMLGIDALAGLRDLKTTKEEREKQGASGGIAIVKMMGMLALKMGAKMGKFIKFIPFIGSLLSFYEAYKMFKEGNILKGVLNVASGIAGFIPGIGSWIGIGIDIINAFIKPPSEKQEDVKEGKGELGFFTKIKQWMGEKIKKSIRFIPVIGTLIRFKEAYNLIKGGNILRGLTSILGAVATISPGVGTLLSGAVDYLNVFLEGKEQQEAKDKQEGKPPSLWSKIKSFLYEKIKKALGNLILFGEGISEIFKGNFILGFDKITGAVSGIPIIGKVFSTLNSWVGEADEQQQNAEASGERKSIFQAFKDVVYDKIKKGLNKLPWWLKKVLKYIPGLKSIIGDVQDPEDQEGFEDAPRAAKEKKKHWYTPWRGEEPEEAQDFIWRKGQKIQKFSSDDNLVSVKNKQVFDQILKQKSEPNVLNVDKIVYAVESMHKDFNTGVTQMQDTVSNVIKGMQGRQAQPPQADLAGISDYAGEVRDPAYILRSRAWDRIRKGYVVV